MHAHTLHTHTNMCKAREDINMHTYGHIHASTHDIHAHDARRYACHTFAELA